MRLVVYTAIYGGYDQPKPAPDDAPAVLFTDDPHLQAPGWNVTVDPLSWIATPMLRAKWWKTHPHLAVPNCDATAWIDGSLTPLPGFGGRCEDALRGLDWVLTKHPLRDCIYTELDASVPLPKYDPVAMRAQIRHYRAQGHPQQWGLFASGCMARLNVTRVNHASEEWWDNNVDWSWQDQLSLPVILRQHPEIRWAAELPWGEPLWGYSEHGP